MWLHQKVSAQKKIGTDQKDKEARLNKTPTSQN